MNNNNSQMPPNQSQQGQLPEHRLAELEQRLRNAELQNTQLRTTVDFLKTGQQNPAQAAQPSAFKPEVETAIKELVSRDLKQMDTQYRQQMGYLADQLDQAKYQLNYGGDKFQKYHDKVENIRQQEIAAGRYIPREEILKMVHFEETGKKSAAPDQSQSVQQQQAQPPKWDPFFNSYVDPVTGQPVQGAPVEDQSQAQAHDQNPAQQQVPMQNFQHQNQNWQQPAQQQQAANQPFQTPPGVRPPVQTNHPNGNAYGQQFALPNQGVNNPQANQARFNPRAPLDLETVSEAQLEAFENGFGDIPL